MISSPQTENDVLGLVLDKPELLQSVSQVRFKPELFTGNRFIIANAIHTLISRGAFPDSGTVAQYLEDNFSDAFQTFGGRPALLDLQTQIPYGDVDFDQYLGRLEEDFRYRKLEQLFRNSAEKTVKDRHGIESSDFITRIQSELLELLSDSGRESSFHEFDHLRSDLITHLAEMAGRDPNEIVGVPTGFRDIDSYLQGMHPGQLLVVAGRPGSGKSALALNVGMHVAFQRRLPVLFFSLEMSERELSQRVFAAESGVPHERIQRGILSENEWARISSANQQMRNAPLYIDDNSAVNLADIRNKCMQVQAEHGQIGLVVVDYLQLMTMDQGRIHQMNRTQEVSELSRSLKVLAKDFGAPVMALSQLNRELERRPNKRPMLSDLRESGSIEQDANVVLFLYRDDYYYPQSAHQGIAEAIIAKNRSGDKGTIYLAFLNHIAKFENLARSGV